DRCCFAVPQATDIYTLSLHDVFRSLRTTQVAGGCRFHTDGYWYAPLYSLSAILTDIITAEHFGRIPCPADGKFPGQVQRVAKIRSEEHTSELQSRENIVCRLLLEKK